jgi:hypothetical protein
MRVVLLVLLLSMIGLGLVYLTVWRRGRIYARRDIDDRVGARVLGEVTGHPTDSAAIVLALTKGREPGTRTLIVPVEGADTMASVGFGDSLAAAGRGLGIEVSLATAAELAARAVGVPGPAPQDGAPDSVPGAALTLVEAIDGLDAQALLVAGSVDIVALVVTYGRTTYRDLNMAGQTLAEVTDADVGVIGVHTRPAAGIRESG